MNQVERLLGQTVVEFANAPSSDEACRKHFTNMQSLMSFHPTFPMQAEKATPLLSSLKPLPGNIELIKLLALEQAYRLEIEEELEVINLVLAGINYESQQLLLKRACVNGCACIVGRQQASVISSDLPIKITYSDIPPITINELNTEFRHEIKKALIPVSDFFRRLRKLMKIGSSLVEMKRKVADTRLQEDSYAESYIDAIDFQRRVEALQGWLCGLLEQISNKERLQKIPYFLHLLDHYNKSLKKSKLVITDDSLLAESPPISESDYFFRGYKRLPFDISLPREPPKTDASFSTERIKDDITYCLVEFVRNPKNIDLIRRCSCNKFFIASKLDSRFKRCQSCRRKSTLSKEQQRVAQKKWRAAQKQEREKQKLETRIKRMMDGGYTREEALEYIRTDSEM